MSAAEAIELAPMTAKATAATILFMTFPIAKFPIANSKDRRP
jgi:hypothetical protein